MITPFTEDGIDFEQMGKLLDFQAANGTAAAVIAGTTGEAATLRREEFEKLTTFSAERCAGRMKVIVGVGGNDTAACLDKARFAGRSGDHDRRRAVFRLKLDQLSHSFKVDPIFRKGRDHRRAGALEYGLLQIFILPMKKASERFCPDAFVNHI